MSRSTRPGAPPVVLLLCRGCCCGTAAKHPRTDHLAQQDALEAAAAERPDVELRLVDCLDECDRGNLAVIRRSGEPPKTRDTWLGGLLTERATDALADWIRSGAVAPLPSVLESLRFRHLAPRRRPRR